MLVDDCEMLPLELVMRRFAFGSVLKREPGYKTDGAPLRFDEVVCEFFHKWAVVMPPLTDVPRQMDEGAARDLYLKDGQWAEGVYTDPYIDIRDEGWFLHPAKVPFDSAQSLMKIEATCPQSEIDWIVKSLMRPCFAALEQAWAEIETDAGPVALADMKIEVGRRKSDGKVVIADVFDNDSWRIWPGADPVRQLDKQSFRDGSDLSEVSDNLRPGRETHPRLLSPHSTLRTS